MRSSLLRRVGGFREELPHTADFEMWMRLALHSDVGYVWGPHQAWYRDHPMGMHHQQFGTTLADLTQIWTAFQLLFRDHAQMIPHCQHLEENVKRRLAQRALLAACRAYDWGIVDPAEVAGLEELAVTIYGNAHTLSVMRGLRWRKRMGSGPCRMLAPCLVLTNTQHFWRKFRGWRLHRLGLL